MYQIIWSATAADSYRLITDYVLAKWSIDSVLKLDDKVQELLDSLSIQKHLCPKLEGYPNLRRCVVTKQTSLVYLVDDENKVVKIVSFIDNRMDYIF